MLPVVVAQPAVQIHRERSVSEFPLVSPVASNDKIMEAWQNFQDLKLKLLDASDFVEVRGEKLAKKSAYRKLALAFGISTELIREDRLEFKSGTAYLITMKAISPSGRFMTAVASCHSDERKFTKSSDVRAIAETRATTRSIANLIGWSAPSAEEVLADEEPIQAKRTESPPMVNYDEMTDRQKKLLTELINQRNPEPEERESALNVIEGLSKVDASSLISEMLQQNAA
ncbi:MAG: hypothetical protein WCW31_00415 [Patescibacteria group bacterium]|jgi:hypothetical protein